MKDVAQVWYEQYKDSRPLKEGPIELEIFKLDLIDRFFPRDVREAELEEFINLKHRSLSVK